jgi:hypothetical protein
MRFKSKRKTANDCSSIQELMSPFIDSMVTAEETDRLETHLLKCEPCQRQLQSFISIRNLVARIEPIAPPEDLVLETRVKLSHERNRNYFDRLETHLNNVLKPLAIPALLGVSLTTLFFGVLFGTIASNTAVLAQDLDDGGALTGSAGGVLGAVMEPVRTTNPTMMRFVERNARDLKQQPLMIETEVGSDGRVLDYRIIAGPESPEVHRWVKDLLSLAQFTPARAFGKPVTSTIILSFVDVRS